MRLILANRDSRIIIRSLKNTIDNSENFNSIEKEVLQELHDRLKKSNKENPLILTDTETGLARHSLMDNFVNEKKYNKFEKKIILNVYNQIRDFEDGNYLKRSNIKHGHTYSIS